MKLPMIALALLSCGGLAAAQGNVVYDSRLPTPKPNVSPQERSRIQTLASQAARAKAWDTPDFRPSEAGCSGQDFQINGVAPGAFTVKGAKQTAYLYTYCYFRPGWNQGLVITQGSQVLAHYAFTALHSEMYALKDINRNGYTELALSGGFTGQGYTTGYLEVAELAPQRRLLASFNSQNKLSVWEDNCGAVGSGGTWKARVIRVTPGAAPRFTQQPISGRCGNERTATGQGSVQAVKATPEPTGWTAVAVTAPVAGGTNILGTTTPFSATALCQKVGCRVLGNAQVGGYLFATYATKDSYSVGSEGYFAFLKNGKTVAVGVYGLGSQDYTDVGTVQDLRDLVTLTGRPLPSLKGVMGPADAMYFPAGMAQGPQVLRRDRNVTLPLGSGLVLTNASQRVALGNDPSKLTRSSSALRFIDVTYVALASEAGAISKLINRWVPAEQQAARQAYLKSIGLVSACPARGATGQPVSVNGLFPSAPTASASTSWALARGYTLNANTMYMALALPGLALSSIEIQSSGGRTMEEAWAAPACVR
ncbi:hypothetical protein QOL99_13775 [Deinococcus sp. MIMF12]|uniref:Serine protease n=1 Tax=Deinococcus rhizophilus TaxID=3049544 RepID=A0ABT7JJI1_9DEIO|nr:hypothetical protein [Deinococcus rhizophilus]MDL2345210.1 hypothetical protein [Deinococcus rhizophilus]